MGIEIGSDIMEVDLSEPALLVLYRAARSIIAALEYERSASIPDAWRLVRAAQADLQSYEDSITYALLETMLRREDGPTVSGVDP